jgi:Asp/Glu/hydantoin racemase
MRRSIRICATIPHAQGLGHWGAAHEEMIAQIGGDWTEVAIVDLPNVPVTSVSNRYDADIVAPAHTQVALWAQEQGFDAVAMGCLMEPGVAAAREMLRIPVIGEAQAAMHMAAIVAPRFSIVGPEGGANATERDLARRYGFAEHLASVREVQAASAVQEDGARAIIGYGSLRMIRAMREALSVPVINPVTAGILVAETVIRSQRC